MTTKATTDIMRCRLTKSSIIARWRTSDSSEIPLSPATQKATNANRTTTASGKSRQATPRQRRPEGKLADIYAIYTSRPAERGASHRLVRPFDPTEGAGTANIDGPQALPYKPRKIARRPK